MAFVQQALEGNLLLCARFPAINSNITANPLEMAHSVRQGMFSIVSLIPAISLLVCIIPMFFYNLTGDFKDKIESELAQQREAKGITISK